MPTEAISATLSAFGVNGAPDNSTDHLLQWDASASLWKRTLPSSMLGGYQASDADLTAIAAITPSNDDVIQRKAGAWTNRTMVQMLADLVAAGAANLASIQTFAGAKTFSAAATFSSTIAVALTSAFAGKATFAKGLIRTPVELTPSAAITLDCSLGDVFNLTVGHTGTIAATNLTAGQTVRINVTAVVTPYTITLSTNFKANGTLATGSVAGKQFVLQFYSDGTNLIEENRTAAL
jgi:hypothetical protein